MQNISIPLASETRSLDLSKPNVGVTSWEHSLNVRNLNYIEGGTRNAIVVITRNV